MKKNNTFLNFWFREILFHPRKVIKIFSEQVYENKLSYFLRKKKRGVF